MGYVEGIIGNKIPNKMSDFWRMKNKPCKISCVFYLLFCKAMKCLFIYQMGVFDWKCADITTTGSTQYMLEINSSWVNWLKWQRHAIKSVLFRQYCRVDIC